MKKAIILLSFLLFGIVMQLQAVQQHRYGLPEKVEVFLDRHFKCDKECKVKFKNGYEVEFDRAGNWVEIESDYHPLPKSIIDILPSGAVRYIAKTYPNRPITKIKRKSRGEIKIELSDIGSILFDSRGNLIKD